MKNIAIIILLLFSIFIMSCEKTEHKIRVINRTDALYFFSIGTNSYGSVAAGGGTSEYKSISNEITHTVIAIGTADTITGSVFLSGKGAHNWSLSLTYDKNIIVGED